MEMEFRLAKKQDMEQLKLRPYKPKDVMETVRKRIIFIL